MGDFGPMLAVVEVLVCACYLPLGLYGGHRSRDQVILILSTLALSNSYNRWIKQPGHKRVVWSISSLRGLLNSPTSNIIESLWFGILGISRGDER